VSREKEDGGEGRESGGKKIQLKNILKTL